ncbi:DUF6153 family protein [Streptomyces sp. NPDC005820]|uniref:DUF6153 family protein n=1 Tax=Streptomyces sp. NPDC005820 TaxID=3157069 RepID=UPI0034110448
MSAVNGLWRRAVCVLGLLVGLLGMHGLAPGGAWSAHAEPRPMASVGSVGSVEAVASAEAHDGCAGEEGHCGGGHAQHADSTCASAAVSGGPVLPGLAADPAPVAVGDETPCRHAVAAPDGARAPPSLAELQLLRI